MDVREKSSNDKRLIDANALISYIDECSQESRFRVYYGYAKSFIDDAPTVDAVEVVRCRECDHKTHDGSGRPYCWQLKMYLNKELDFFCKYGKRKGDAD